MIGIGCQGRKLHSTAFPHIERPTIRTASHATNCLISDGGARRNIYAQEALKSIFCLRRGGWREPPNFPPALDVTSKTSTTKFVLELLSRRVLAACREKG